MKNITSLLTIIFTTLICSSNFAQTILDDFEPGSGITTWWGDACQLDTNFNNPVMTGINTSSKVLRYGDVGGQYANVRFDAGRNFSLAFNNVFTIKVYVPSSGLTGTQNNQITLKLQDGTVASPWVTQTQIVKNIVLDQWQTITFDFANDVYINANGGSPAPILRTDLNRVLFQINGENNFDNVLAYLDDFTYYDTITSPNNFNYLVWSDEFNGTGAISNVNWFHQTQLPSGGSWFNGEVQHYTNRAVNSSQNGGSLNLIAKKEVFTDQGRTKQYTSARLNSKFAFKYGKVEIRAKLPTGSGTWPAIWMLGKNISEGGAYWQTQGFGTTGWPACGEIDIMEHWGSNQNFVQSAMHTPSSSGATVNHGGQTIPTASSAFHIYTLEWSSTQMIFSVDGIVHYIYNPAIKNASTWPYDAEQYILLNIAIEPSIAASFTQDTMEIDYVRVYQEGFASIKENEVSKSHNFFPNPANDNITIELGENHTENIKVKIFSIQGKLIKSVSQQTEGTNLKIDDLGDLPKGLYMVNYKINGKNYNLKFIKS